MNLFKWLTDKLKKRDYNIGIMRFGDNIIVPGREYCKNESQIEILEEYKKHYLEELFKRNTTTLNFNSNILKLNMNMNVALILRVLMDNEDFYQLAPEELIIQSEKLKMYYEEINALETETILRLIALKEIEKNNRVPKRNRMALVEEINQLRIILEMYSYQKAAIAIELKNYMDMISIRVVEIKEDILNQRLNNLLFITDEIYDKKELEKYTYAKVKIAILERKCEKYAYLNKDEVETLKEKINRLTQEKIEENNRNDLLTTCIILERKLLLFYYYANHSLIEENDLQKLYEFKFKLLTCNIYSLKDSPIKESDNGYPYYREIIEKKIEAFMQNENESYKEYFDIPSNLECIVKYLKNKQDEYDVSEILLNKYKLSFLLSLEYSEGLYDFFNQTKITISNNDLDEFSKECTKIPGITWDNEFPLSSYFELMTEENKHPLYSLYVAYADEKNNLIVPIGVKTVDFESLSKPLHDKIKEKLKEVSLITCPKTLKEISGYINFGDEEIRKFLKLKKEDVKYRNLQLNEGLEKIGPNVFKLNIGTLIIPSSVKEIVRKGNTQNLERIVFSDFENSEIVNNREELLRFIEIISKEVDTGKTQWHFPSEHSLKIQEKYSRRGYSTNDYQALFDSEYPMYIYKFQLTVSSLIFQSNTLNKGIVIPAKYLQQTFLKKDYDRYNYYGRHQRRTGVGSPDYDMIYEKIRTLILEKANYDICHDEKAKVKKKSL